MRSYWKLGLLVIFTVFSLARVDCEVNSNRIKLFDYGDKEKELNPTETLSLLQKLDDFYSESEDDVESLAQSKLLRPLIEANYRAFHKCASSSFKSIDSLIETYMIYASDNRERSLVAYLRHCRSELFKFCKNIYNEDMEEAINEISGVELHNMALLSDSILLVQNIEAPYFAPLPKPVIWEGVFEYICLLSKDYMDQFNKDHRGGRDIYEKECQKKVIDLCQSIKSKITPSFNFIEILAYDKKLTMKVESELRQSMTYLEICEQLLEDPTSTCTGSYQRLQDNLPELKKSQKRMENFSNYMNNLKLKKGKQNSKE